MGSLSLLQWIFPTQESTWGLLHCRGDSLPTELSDKSSKYRSLGLKNLGILSCMSVFCKWEMPVGFRRACGDWFSPEIWKQSSFPTVVPDLSLLYAVWIQNKDHLTQRLECYLEWFVFICCSLLTCVICIYLLFAVNLCNLILIQINPYEFEALTLGSVENWSLCPRLWLNLPCWPALVPSHKIRRLLQSLADVTEQPVGLSKEILVSQQFLSLHMSAESTTFLN